MSSARFSNAPLSPEKWMAPLVAFVIITIACVYVGFLATTRGNVIAWFFQTVPVFVFVLSVVYPRGSLFGLLILAPFFGFFKKLLVLAGNFPYMTLYFFFSISLVALLGVCIGTMFNIVLRRPMPMDSFRCMVICAIFSVVMMAAFYVVDTPFALSITGAAFFNVIWILYHYSQEKRIPVWVYKIVVLTGIVAALFGIYQYFFGFTHLDRLYWEVEIRYGRFVSFETMRPNSTFGNENQFGWAMILCLLVVLFGLPKSQHSKVPVLATLRWPLALMFLFGVWVATKKGPMIGLMIIPILVYVLGRPRVATFMTLFGFGLIAAIVVYQHEIIDWLWIASETTARIHPGLTLNTFSVRVESIATTFDTRLVNLVGPTSVVDLPSHNFLSKIVYTIGLLPGLAVFLTGAGLFIYVQYRLRYILRGPNGLQVRVFTAYFIAALLAGLIGTNVITTFPVSLYLPLALGMALYYAYGKWRTKEDGYPRGIEKSARRPANQSYRAGSVPV